jgi:hypothetical protein
MRFQPCSVVLSAAISLWLPAHALAQTVGFVYGLARSTYSPASHSLYGLAVRASGTLTPLAGFPLPTGGR